MRMKQEEEKIKGVCELSGIQHLPTFTKDPSPSTLSSYSGNQNTTDDPHPFPTLEKRLLRVGRPPHRGRRGFFLLFLLLL